MKIKTIAVRLRDYCIFNGITQEACAEEFGVKYETFSKWVRSETFPRRDQWQCLIDKIGWSLTEMLAMHKEHKSILALRHGGVTEYSVKSFLELLSDGWTPEVILNHMDCVLEYFPLPSIEGNRMGSSEKWSNIISLSPNTGCALFHKGKHIGGYWFFIPVRSEVYDMILEGENVNETLEVSDILPFQELGDYDIYFVDFFTLQNHRAISAMKLMFYALTNLLESLAQEGFFARRISANITEIQARNLCANRGLRYITDHKHHRIFKENASGNATAEQNPSEVPSEIWEVRLSEDLDGHFFGNNEHLRELYKLHFE